jgi:hypothetical protein
MKSNTQLRHEGQDEAPQPPPVQFELPIGASSSQTAPPPPHYDVGFAQVMAALSSLQWDLSSIQWEVSSISVRVEQCQLYIQDCLQYHHPSHDNEDWVIVYSFILVFCWFIWRQFLLLFLFWIFVNFYNSGFYLLYLPLSYWDIKGEYFISGFYTLFTVCHFETKRGSIFCFGSGMYF